MGLFDKMIILYLCISLGFAFWQPDVVFGLSTPLNIFNTGVDSHGEITITNDTSLLNQQGQGNCANNCSGLTAANNRVFSQGRVNTGDNSIINTLFFIIDPIWNVIAIVVILFEVLIAPVTIMLNPAFTGLPTYLVVSFCLPLIAMGWISIIMFVRGYN